MKEIIIKSEVRKIKCEWSRELVKDLQSYHNIDASDELERILRKEMRREIRRKKIDKIFKHTA